MAYSDLGNVTWLFIGPNSCLSDSVYNDKCYIESVYNKKTQKKYQIYNSETEDTFFYYILKKERK